MSKLDIDKIITSPSAKSFLQMVTKDFYSNSYTGLWMYEVIGREWDEIRAWSEGIKNEVNPQTCTWSIPIWEEIYGFVPDDSLSLEQRRQQVMAKIVGAKPISPEVMQRGIAALLGTSRENIDIDERAGPYRFDISIYLKRMPPEFTKLIPYIRSIKPSHLRFETSIDVTPDELSSEYYIGGRLTDASHVPIITARDVLNFKTAIYTGGKLSSVQRREIITQDDVFEFTDTAHIGGQFTTAPTVSVHSEKDIFIFENRLYSGGKGMRQTNAIIPESHEMSEAVHNVHVGGNAATMGTLPVMQGEIEYDYPYTLERTMHFGGAASRYAALVVPENSDIPEKVQIIRTGGRGVRQVTAAISENTDPPEIKNTVGIGGSAEYSVKMAVPVADEIIDYPEMTDTLKSIGEASVVSNINIQGEKDAAIFEDRLNAGGNIEHVSSISIPPAPEIYNYETMETAAGAGGLLENITNAAVPLVE